MKMQWPRRTWRRIMQDRALNNWNHHFEGVTWKTIRFEIIPLDPFHIKLYIYIYSAIAEQFLKELNIEKQISLQILQLSFSLERYYYKISPLKSSIEIFYIKKKKKERREKGGSLLNHLKLNCNVEEERAYKRA